MSATSEGRESANDWQRRVFGGPQLAEALTTSDNLTEAQCPNCRHLLSKHSVDLGCHVGWRDYGDDGCNCPLTLALQHAPKREFEVTP